MVSKLDLYRIFCQVGESKSFSEAARELYLTQPAVSQSIMQLERELDVRLFNRTPKGAELTQEGKLLYEYAHSALNLLRAGEQKLEEFKNVAVGELTIGVGDSISRYFLMPYLEKFHTTYPHIKFKIENGTTFELCELVKSGKADIAFCNLPVEDEQLLIEPCGSIQDTFVYGEKYEKVMQQKVTFEQLQKVPLIMLESKSNSRQYVDSYAAKWGVALEPEFELGSHDLLLEFARTNFGVACVIREFAQESIDTGELREVELAHPIPSRQIGLCSLRSVPLSPASERFVQIVRDESRLFT
ncbi:LysR family transcriptional regulator [Planococcaceae bacterium Storch 2/2-2]|nr:LysR family transcriptional regulator [Planococcaceae bacterium Storch 2/2-2]